MRGAPGWARLAHRVLHKFGKKPFLYAGGLGRRLHQPVAWLERRYARPLRVGARSGVVIAAGGFVANRALMREHAPAYRGGLALGTVADDGSGMRLGVAAGGVTKFLDRVSCWRFITPPSAFLRGVLVDRAGGGSAMNRGTEPRLARPWCTGQVAGRGCWSTRPSCPSPGASFSAARSGSSWSRRSTC